MSSGRKGGIPPFIQSPVPNSSKGLKMKVPTMTAEYMDAVHVLNENLLNQACNILLDDQNEDGDKKLLEMYHRCETSYNVIKKHQPVNSSNNSSSTTVAGGLPGAPNLNIPQSSSSKNSMAAAGMRPKLKKGGINERSSSMLGSIPMRGRAMASSKQSPGSLKNLNVATSNNNDDGGGNNNKDMILPPASKKARISPTNTSGGSTGGGGGSSGGGGSGSGGSGGPPQSALDFLAKLNRDKDSNSPNNKTPAAEDPPKPSPPTRKNPPRGMMNRRSSGPT